MKPHILNIGCNAAGITDAFTPQFVLAKVRAAFHGADVQLVNVVHSTTEKTAVISISSDLDAILAHFPWEDALFNISVSLLQDCVAFAPFGNLDLGVLVGPNTEAWGGVFNPNEFISA